MGFQRDFRISTGFFGINSKFRKFIYFKIFRILEVFLGFEAFLRILIKLQISKGFDKFKIDSKVSTDNREIPSIYYNSKKIFSTPNG